MVNGERAADRAHVPPARASAKPIDTRGVVIAVTRDGAMFSQGYQLASIGEVREYLEQVHRQALEKTLLDGYWKLPPWP